MRSHHCHPPAPSQPSQSLTQRHPHRHYRRRSFRSAPLNCLCQSFATDEHQQSQVLMLSSNTQLTDNWGGQHSQVHLTSPHFTSLSVCLVCTQRRTAIYGIPIWPAHTQHKKDKTRQSRWAPSIHSFHPSTHPAMQCVGVHPSAGKKDQTTLTYGMDGWWEHPVVKNGDVYYMYTTSTHAKCTHCHVLSCVAVRGHVHSGRHHRRHETPHTAAGASKRHRRAFYKTPPQHAITVTIADFLTETHINSHTQTWSIVSETHPHKCSHCLAGRGGHTHTHTHTFTHTRAQESTCHCCHRCNT
mmetsp:Transcript_29928/g.86754  ORF Transcript_29928/g.86754 Transcript_29928/m.86754 type:complete len:299 (-) Transcript_29928:1435-2331(-)